jgi:hypothetical protein
MSGGSQEEIAQDIIGVRYEYSDGEDWYDTWGEVEGKAKAANSQIQPSNLEGLPEAVRITLMMDSNPTSKKDSTTGKRIIEPPLVFQTVVQLNLAEVTDNTGSSSGGSSAQPQSGMPNGGGQ